ncbi:MAG: DUF4388 domain-containing protein [Actinomycetota bacterium]|nr:DUF4388 domain-containing protein [Actinomycetota bacterium]
MRLEGSLEAFSLTDLFQLLTATRKSGGLHLYRGTEHGVIRVVAGAISGASSDTARQSLARRLVGTGRLTDDALSAGVATVRADPSVGLARAMHEAGAIDGELLLAVAREHSVDALFDMLRWTDATFAFEVDEPDTDDIGLRQDADGLVAAAGLHIDAWSTLAGQISSPDVVVRLTAAPAHDPTLTRDEWALVALIDGRRTVGDLVTLCGRGEFATVAVLGPLVERGLLEVPGDGATDDAATALIRRQHLIESLEGGSAPGEPAEDEHPSADDGPAPGPDGAPAEAGELSADPDEPIPARVPEPRTPEHTLDQPTRAPMESRSAPAPAEWPEEELPSLPPRLQSGRRSGGPDSGIGPIPDPDPHQAIIEPDPAVDKSMLLRLIAGVRVV